MVEWLIIMENLAMLLCIAQIKSIMASTPLTLTLDMLHQKRSKQDIPAQGWNYMIKKGIQLNFLI